MLTLRTALFETYKGRVQLGEFDANSGVILAALHALIEIMDHMLIEMKKKKPDVHK